MNCPTCGTNWRQMKVGFNRSGSQRHKCGKFKRAYTPEAKEKGYPKETRILALRMYVELAGAVQEVTQQSVEVALWIKVTQVTIPKPMRKMKALS